MLTVSMLPCASDLCQQFQLTARTTSKQCLSYGSSFRHIAIACLTPTTLRGPLLTLAYPCLPYPLLMLDINMRKRYLPTISAHGRHLITYELTLTNIAFARLTQTKLGCLSCPPEPDTPKALGLFTTPISHAFTCSLCKQVQSHADSQISV